MHTKTAYHIDAKTIVEFGPDRNTYTDMFQETGANSFIFSEEVLHCALDKQTIDLYSCPA